MRAARQPGGGAIALPPPRTRSPLPAAAPAPRAALALDEAEARLRRGLVLLLFTSIFLQRFSVPFLDVALVLPVTLGVIGWFTLQGLLRVDVLRAATFCLLVAACLLSAAVNWQDVSPASLPLFLLIYACYLFRAEASETLFRSLLDAFQAMVAVCAVAGILQFLAQFVLGSGGPLFTWYGILPDWLLTSGFNTRNPLTWDGDIYKANGFFLIEPSTFSQYLCLAAVFEMLYFGATRRFYLYLVALPLSYSGTGMLVLLPLLPLALVARQRWNTMLGIGAILVLAALTADLWQADKLVDRVNEFGNANTSATARFVAGAWMIRDFQLDRAVDLLLGMGPGAIRVYQRLVEYEAHDPPWAKLPFEYGLVGFAAFLAYGAACLSQARSPWIVAALVIGFFLFGGMLLEPRFQVLILVFCTLLVAPAPETPALRGKRR